MNFSRGHSGTKVRNCEFGLVFSRKNKPEFTKMGEIHELFVLALSLVWFAGVTPDTCHGALSCSVLILCVLHPFPLFEGL